MRSQVCLKDPYHQGLQGLCVGMLSFRSGNAIFCARPGKSGDDAEAYIRCAAPVCVPACPVRTPDRLCTGRQVNPQIDAGIAEKGRLWMETH
ncbi:MAG: hypothetical protein DRJ64_07680 [Thermoprotei archaeon]|nr:MAG: hypothetical protein DRJ64_07680 [Thermoprotei archaeon]